MRACQALLLALLAAMTIVVVTASPAEACSCIGFTKFNQLLHSEPLTIVGRVSSLGSAGLDPADPRSVEVEVEWVAKGSLGERHVRVWNSMAGTSCGGAFGITPPGTELAIALHPVPAKLEEIWTLLDFRPFPEDYLIVPACAEPYVILRTPKERSKYFGKRLR